MIETIFNDQSNVSVASYTGLTINFCKEANANYILRGLRNSRDFEYESEIAQMNNMMEQGVETVFTLSLPEYAAINSTIVREIYKNGGSVAQFIPDGMSLD